MTSRQLNILHVMTRFAGGGSERRVRDFIQALPEHRHFVVVGRESDVGSAKALLAPAEVRVESHLIRPPHPVEDPLAVIRLASLMRRCSIDLVHTVQSKAGIVGRLAAAGAKVEARIHAVSMANFGEGFGAIGAAYRLAERATARRTTAFTVVGANLRDRYVEAGIGALEDYAVIRSSIDLRSFTEARSGGRSRARAALGIDGDRFVVSYVGSLDERKRVMMLPGVLDALRHTSDRPPLLLVAGVGPLEAPLEASLSEMGLLGHVRLLGYSGQVPLVLAAADCCLLLSAAEGLPQVLVQATAVGTPFVVTPVDGGRELLSLGSTGAILDDLSSPAIADRCLAVAALEAGTADLRQWDIELVKERYRFLVSAVLGS